MYNLKRKSNEKMEKMNGKEIANHTPILIPSESIIEGYVKTKKSFRIECDYFGTVMSSQKVVVGSTSKITGDIICRDLDLSGEVIGNIFCSGKIKVNGGSKITGKVYTKLFENEADCVLDCVVQIPKDDHIVKIEELFENLDTSLALSKDKTLSEIRSIFYENVYAHRINPDQPLVQDFTSQRKDSENKVLKRAELKVEQRVEHKMEQKAGNS
jgi:cytoskeletal protein CcmA (bactofilin family)